VPCRGGRLAPDRFCGERGNTAVPSAGQPSVGGQAVAVDGRRLGRRSCSSPSARRRDGMREGDQQVGQWTYWKVGGVAGEHRRAWTTPCFRGGAKGIRPGQAATVGPVDDPNRRFDDLFHLVADPRSSGCVGPGAWRTTRERAGRSGQATDRSIEAGQGVGIPRTHPTPPPPPPPAPPPPHPLCLGSQ